jgi:hypothetical protein
VSRKPRSHSNERRIRRAIACSVGLLALLLAGAAFPTDARACHDYGDAPDSYGTLLASNGAGHAVVSGFHLGALIDYEGDGQASVGADGDDLGGVDDEDGIQFMQLLMVGAATRLNVILTTDDVLDAFLNAWVDFNGDGDWDDDGEQIFTDVSLIAGGNPLSFLVPAGATPGDTYARFRLDSGGGLTPYGLANDGEVEDYVVRIVATPEPATLSLVALGLIVSAAFRRPRK